MRYAVLSDIHSNLPALQSVLEACHRQGIKDFINIGDIVGYGANPRECLTLIQDLKISTVAGNHDWAVTGKFDLSDFFWAAKAGILWTQNQISLQEKTFLSGLNLVEKWTENIFVHGTLKDPGNFDYLISPSQAVETFGLMDRMVCFIGHTHVPQILMYKNGLVASMEENEIQLNKALKYIVNVGSVGQPRDGNPKAAFCIYDTEEKTIALQRVSYDIQAAQKEILKAGLPAILASRLSAGQ